MQKALHRAASLTVAATALVAATAGTALADPPRGTVPAKTDVVGVGSDTTQFVLNAISAKYNVSHPAGSRLYSFDATGTATIVPKKGCAAITRPDGSSRGIAALIADTHGCIDFARSSRGPKSDGSEAKLAFLPFARDAVTTAVATTTNSPTNLTTAQLKGIYTCTVRTWNKVGGRSTAAIKPLLPQTGSGTRSFFLSAIGITDAQVGSCVTQGIQENSQPAIAGDPNKIAPFSAARYAFFRNSGTKLTVRLNNTNSTAPVTTTKIGAKTVFLVNGRYTPVFSRSVFNVVKRVNNAVPAKYTALFGAKGYICTNTTAVNTIKVQGFLPNCTTLTH